MRFDEFYNGEYLFHATYRPILSKIKKSGLGGDFEIKAWQESSHKVYLATKPEIAYSYAETSEEVPEEWLDEIVVLKIRKSDLDESKLSLDKNVLDNTGETLEYDGIIPWSSLEVMEYSE